jgi:hypothetical protein
MNRIITYPRSGTHYLQNLILTYSSQKIDCSHYAVFDNSFIITVARDPFDSIQSTVAMKKHYFPDTYLDTDYINYYIDIYDFLNKHASIVIDYNDLISFPEEITKNLCDLLGFKKMPMEHEMMQDSKEYEYLVSSKTVKEYNQEYFDNKQIQECYPHYLDLLSKSIKLT